MVDLTAAVRDAVAAMDATVAAAGASMTISDHPTIEADPTLMRRLFTNLISNSIQHRHRHRPPEVPIEGGRAEADGGGTTSTILHPVAA